MATAVLDRNDLLTIPEAARRLPGQPHRATVWRWCSRGVLTPTGERVRLRYRRLGRRALIAPEDIDRFADALSDADQQARQRQRITAPIAHAPRRSARAEAAEREAEALGI